MVAVQLVHKVMPLPRFDDDLSSSRSRKDLKRLSLFQTRIISGGNGLKRI